LVAEEYPDETGWGGIGTYHYNLARGFVALSCNVVIIARALAKESVKISDGIIIYRILPFFGEDAVLEEILGYRLAVANKLRQVIRKHRIDIIETPEWKAETVLFQALHSEVPIAVRMHSPLSVIKRLDGSQMLTLSQRIQERLEYRLMRDADFVSSSSRSLIRLARKYGKLNRAIVPIVNPANNVDFTKEEPPLKLASKFAGYTNKLLYVGRLEKRKGIESLLDAMPAILEKHPSSLLILAGRDSPTGPQGKSTLQGLKQGRGSVFANNVCHVGFVEYLRLKDYYNLATVCIIPSLYDNFPAVCLEAMACGCPVVASRCGGMSEIVQHSRSGYLVNPRSARDIAQRTIALLSSERRRRRFGVNAMTRISEHFDRVRATERLLKRYVNVISKHAAKRARLRPRAKSV
jgi:glycosyltransferase involved in cell wall biosynthesis